MRNIFVYIRLFSMEQSVYLFENDKLVESTMCQLKDLSTFLSDYANSKNADNITLLGGKLYCSKVKKSIEEKTLTKYNKKINVEIKD